ncbi:MAG: hypothetical protein HYS74_02495 [Parcubacteria group bacterium]|nr:hypothetical protein [Parcubacteria group bacterium]
MVHCMYGRIMEPDNQNFVVTFARIAVALVFLGGAGVLSSVSYTGDTESDAGVSLSAQLFSVPYVRYDDVFGKWLIVSSSTPVADLSDKKATGATGDAENVPAPLPVVLPKAPPVIEKPNAPPGETQVIPEEEIVPEAVPLLTDPEGPDFTASAFSYYGATLEEGKVLSFSFIVRNAGKKSSEESIFSQLYLDKNNDGSRDRSFSRQETPPLLAGAQETLTWRNALTLEGGTHRVEVCVDVSNAVMESDEENNCASLTLTIESRADNADLTVLEASVTPSSPSAGNVVSFYAVVYNQGKKRAPVEKISLAVDGITVAHTSTISLGVGEQRKIEWPTIWIATAGPHAYKACADSKNNIAEPDEENNCLSGAFVVNP